MPEPTTTPDPQPEPIDPDSFAPLDAHDFYLGDWARRALDEVPCG